MSRGADSRRCFRVCSLDVELAPGTRRQAAQRHEDREAAPAYALPRSIFMRGAPPPPRHGSGAAHCPRVEIAEDPIHQVRLGVFDQPQRDGGIRGRHLDELEPAHTLHRQSCRRHVQRKPRGGPLTRTHNHPALRTPARSSRSSQCVHSQYAEPGHQGACFECWPACSSGG